jgi:hypothetical protein
MERREKKLRKQPREERMVCSLESIDEMTLDLDYQEVTRKFKVDYMYIVV